MTKKRAHSPHKKRADAENIPQKLPPQTRAVLRPGQSAALLQALHILTPDARLNQDSRRKLKQVEHLLQFLCPMLDEVAQHNGDCDVQLADCGAGKSYLGFLLYERWFAPRRARLRHRAPRRVGAGRPRAGGAAGLGAHALH